MRRSTSAGARRRGSAGRCLAAPCAVAACNGRRAASAQTRTVEILNADLVTVEADSLGVVRRLDGNVRLRQDTTLLSARSAVYDERASLVTLRGGVRVVSGRNTLTAETVLYHSDTRVAEAQTGVRVTDGESVLTAPADRARHADRGLDVLGRRPHPLARRDHHVARGHVQLGHARRAPLGPIPLVDSAAVLTAARGTYDAGIQRADVAGTVRLRRPDTRLARRLARLLPADRARARLRPGGARADRDRAPPARPTARPRPTARAARSSSATS